MSPRDSVRLICINKGCILKKACRSESTPLGSPQGSPSLQLMWTSPKSSWSHQNQQVQSHHPRVQNVSLGLKSIPTTPGPKVPSPGSTMCTVRTSVSLSRPPSPKEKSPSSTTDQEFINRSKIIIHWSTINEARSVDVKRPRCQTNQDKRPQVVGQRWRSSCQVSSQHQQETRTSRTPGFNSVPCRSRIMDQLLQQQDLEVHRRCEQVTWMVSHLDESIWTKKPREGTNKWSDYQ